MRSAVERLTEAWKAGGCMDEHLADQLVVFMAVAQGPSRILCPARSSISSQHLQTAVHFAGLLTNTRFWVLSPNENDCAELDRDPVLEAKTPERPSNVPRLPETAFILCCEGAQKT